MCVLIEDIINRAFGERIGRKIEVAADDEAEKGVGTLPCGSRSAGVILRRAFVRVRQSDQSTHAGISWRAVEDFKREREELRAEHKMKSQCMKKKACRAWRVIKKTRIRSRSGNSRRGGQQCFEPVIDTSHCRSNLCTNTNRAMSNHLRLSLFYRRSTSILVGTSGFLTVAMTAALRLTIPSTWHRVYLVMAYANEKAIKIPLSEIYAVGGEQPYKALRTTSLCLFAAIAVVYDALLCVSPPTSTGLLGEGYTSVGHRAGAPSTVCPDVSTTRRLTIPWPTTS